ncbi:MAG: hypothetical protein NTZ05_22300, partial [Chloroflexi bacterium]|nr:hypothetical protein [Chloroflexota bacterium]
ANAQTVGATITLPAGTYQLTLTGAGENVAATGDLDIVKSITINGAGAGTTFIQAGTNSADGIDRVFDVLPSATLNLNGVTVRYGKLPGNATGGGINSSGTLTVTNSTITSNFVTSPGSGGGIQATAGTLTVTNSTISGNSSAFAGGGISSAVTTTVINSTISNNTSTNSSGGGIASSGTLTVINSTFAGNIAATSVVGSGGGGIFISGGTATVVQSTIAGNATNAPNGGGGILNNSTLSLKSTLLDTNFPVNCGVGSGILFSQNYSISNDLSCLLGGAQDVSAPLGPTVFPLADNGGTTLTMALLSGSLPVDRIPVVACTDGNILPAPITTDQRGMPRPVPAGGACDVGAYEVQPPAVSNRYVATATGSDASNDCKTVGSPCKTIAYAVGVALAGDTVIIAAGTYPERITINKNLTVNGAGAATTIIDGGHAGSVVTVSSGSASSISGVTIRNGTSGGGAGIYHVAGTLTVTDSILTGNTTSGVGGGIYSAAPLIVIRSAINGNTAVSYGGGIASPATLTVVDSTISGNTGTLGGAIGSTNTVTVINSTITGNTGTVAGGIVPGPNTTIKNSIVAKQASGPDCSTTIGTQSNNLESGTTCGFSGNGSVQNVTDPKLGPLQMNGGPTPTMALLAGSPAVNGGNNTVCTTEPLIAGKDQRGYPRSRNTSCDMGALEALVVTDTADVADMAAGDGICATSGSVCTLRAAISTANQEGGDVIVLPAGTFTQSLSGANDDNSGGDWDITTTGGYVTISGPDAATTKLQAAATPGTGSERVLDLRPGAFAYLRGITVQNGSASSGAGIRNTTATLNISNAVVTSNTATGNGGGINNTGTGPTLIMDGVTVSNNSAGQNGGGIHNSTGTVTIKGGVISGNQAVGDSALGGGGGIASAGVLTVTDATVTGNTVTTNGGGGGIGATIIATVTGSTISGNTAPTGGGIAVGPTSPPNVTVRNSTVAGNTATTGGGGGIGIGAGGTLNVFSSAITGNTASGGGAGGAFGNLGILTVVNSTLAGNFATLGGAIGNAPSGIVTLLNDTISANTGSSIGGVANQGPPGSLIVGNTIIAKQTIGGNCTGTVISVGHNLSNDANCLFVALGDLQNVTQPNLVGPLQNNGGPTQTMALPLGSAAIGAGDNIICSDPTNVNKLDQRGTARPVLPNGLCDIGAFEAPQAGAKLAVIAIAPTVPVQG